MMEMSQGKVGELGRMEMSQVAVGEELGLGGFC